MFLNDKHHWVKCCNYVKINEGQWLYKQTQNLYFYRLQVLSSLVVFGELVTHEASLINIIPPTS